VLRLLADGSRDPGFGTNGSVTHPEYSNDARVVVQRDGRIVTGGAHHGGSDATLFRLMPDGTVDRSYGAEGRATAAYKGYELRLFVMTVDDASRIIAAGTMAKPSATGNNPGSFVAVRFTPEGALDETFGSGGWASPPNPPAMDFRAFGDGAIVRGGLVCAVTTAVMDPVLQLGVGMVRFSS